MLGWLVLLWWLGSADLALQAQVLPAPQQAQRTTRGAQTTPSHLEEYLNDLAGDGTAPRGRRRPPTQLRVLPTP